MSRELQAAQAILSRAEGRPLSIWQRSQLRAAVRAHEARAGCSLLAEAEAIAAPVQAGHALTPEARDRLRLLLDVAEELTV